MGILNPEAESEVHMDTSMYGFCAILLQKDTDDQLHPTYFMSRNTTTQTQQRYHSYELEVLEIIEALTKFRSYLLGLNFKIITNCVSFTKTLQKKELATRIAH